MAPITGGTAAALAIGEAAIVGLVSGGHTLIVPAGGTAGKIYAVGVCTVFLRHYASSRKTVAIRLLSRIDLNVHKEAIEMARVQEVEP